MLCLQVAVAQRTQGAFVIGPTAFDLDPEVEHHLGVEHGFHVLARILADAGIVTTVRKTRGDDIDAACGQLAGEVQDRTRAAARMLRQPVAVKVAL